MDVSRRHPSTGYRKRRRLVLASAAVAILGAVVALFALFPDRNPPPQVFDHGSAVDPKTPIKAPLSDEARRVAARFVLTAVARKDLAEAWTLSGPNVRGGLTRAQFLTGNNGVIPYPVAQQKIAPYRIDYSYTDSALIRIALTPRKGSVVRPKDFYLGLIKVGKGSLAHWLVNNWAVILR
jgi:hypothetical protein